MEKIDNSRQERWWLFSALAVAAFYSVLALRLAFRLPDLVQDDARQHVFWMARFRDPTLFPNDLIADYFQAVAPAGYKAIYWIFVKFGVEPLLLSKLLPALIGLATAYLAFKFFVRLSGNARGAFFASVIICQLIWFKDDVVSATPRAFVYPLFLAFLLFLVERRVVAGLVMLALQALIYPQSALVSLAILALGMVDWKERRLSRDGSNYGLAIGGFALVSALLILFRSSMSNFGPAISPTEARTLPEFLDRGRSVFFSGGVDFWLTGPRSGFWPGAIPTYLTILGLLGTAILIAPVTISALDNFRKHRGMLGRILIASLVMWAAAHLLLFKLHLPARYSHWAIRLLLGLTGGLTMISILATIDVLQRRWRYVLGACATLLLVAAPLFQKKFPSPTYVEARPRELFEFLKQQPKDIVVATLRESASKIPVFAHRSVLVSAEHAIPYHTGYYHEIRERGRALINAHLTPDPNQLRAFIEKYHVDFMIVTRQPVTTRNIKNMRWFGEIMDNRELAPSGNEQSPALAAFVDQAKVWEGDRDIVLDARFIAQTITANERSTSR